MVAKRRRRRTVEKPALNAWRTRGAQSQERLQHPDVDACAETSQSRSQSSVSGSLRAALLVRHVERDLADARECQGGLSRFVLHEAVRWAPN